MLCVMLGVHAESCWGCVNHYRADFWHGLEMCLMAVSVWLREAFRTSLLYLRLHTSVRQPTGAS